MKKEGSFFVTRPIENLNMKRRSRFSLFGLILIAGCLPSVAFADVGKPAYPMPPPKVFRGVYLTSWSAGSESRVGRVISLAKAGLVNTVVFDIKDATGYVAFDTNVPEVARYKSKRRIIRNLASLVAKLHNAGLYVVARIVVFQDPRLALARPDLAVHQRSKLLSEEPALSVSTLWLDNRKLAWIDPAATGAWDYITAIAKDALSQGVDEINFDYVRFPSDGDLQDMYFPAWQDHKARHEVISQFFAHLRKELGQSRLSVDLFGLATLKRDELGIGQIIEEAYRYFDYVCPMVYPSHYPPTFMGYANPAEHPYQVVHYSLDSAQDRLLTFRASETTRAKIRPWLQDFSLGAVYDSGMVKAQIAATQDALHADYCGFTLWNPSNVYSLDGLR
jgi:hypothetical protein